MARMRLRQTSAFLKSTRPAVAALCAQLVAVAALSAQVTAPTTVARGKLVELKSEGGSPSWMVLEPTSLDFRTYEGGSVFVCSSGNGEFSQIVVMCVDWTQQHIEKVVIAIEGDEPEPEPEPPKPPDPPNPDEGYLGLTSLARDLAPVTASGDTALSLARLYDGVADQIDAGAIKHPATAQQTLIKATTEYWKASGGRAAQKPWDSWASAIQRREEAEQLTEVSDLSRAYRAITAGLKQFAAKRGVQRTIRYAPIRTRSTTYVTPSLPPIWQYRSNVNGAECLT